MACNKVLDGLLGVAVGDAIGVPVEFQSRAELEVKPVVDIRGYGTYGQAAGTWSDDSSLTFCLAESLIEGYELKDMAERFVQWKAGQIIAQEVALFARLIEKDITTVPRPEIQSTGYVLHSLEAAFWCFLR